MGCCMGLKASANRITFVALSRHLAPRHVCLHVGRRVRASRRRLHCQHHRLQLVNVFLGLGLPWAAASIYWSMHGDEQESAAQTLRGSRGTPPTRRWALPSRRATSASSPSSAAAPSSASPRSSASLRARRGARRPPLTKWRPFSSSSASGSPTSASPCATRMRRSTDRGAAATVRTDPTAQSSSVNVDARSGLVCLHPSHCVQYRRGAQTTRRPSCNVAHSWYLESTGRSRLSHSVQSPYTRRGPADHDHDYQYGTMRAQHGAARKGVELEA